MSQAENQPPQEVLQEAVQDKPKLVIPSEVPRRKVLEWFARGAGIFAGTQVFGAPEPRKEQFDITLGEQNKTQRGVDQVPEVVSPQNLIQDKERKYEEIHPPIKATKPIEEERMPLQDELLTNPKNSVDESGQPEATAEKKELIEISPNTLVLDFAPTSQKKGTTQTIMPPSPDEMVQLLFEGAVSKQKLKEEFGVDFITNKEAFKKYPREVLGYSAMGVYEGHGNFVHSIIEGMQNGLGYKQTVGIIPVQQFVDSKNVQFIHDEFGNKGFSLTIDHKKIIEGLKNTNQKIVNFSLQFGPVGFIYKEKEAMKLNVGFKAYPTADYKEEYVPEGTIHTGATNSEDSKRGYENTYEDKDGKRVYPITPEEYEKIKKQKEVDIVGKVEDLERPKIEQLPAYTKENAHEHLAKLFEICAAYPDKFFVAAAGNHGDDLRSVTNRPSNLLLVQQDGYGDIQGADMAVNNSEVVPFSDNGSSISTAIVSSAASILADRGMKPEEIKKKILELTEVENRRYKDGNDYQIRKLDIDKAKELLKAQ